MKQLHPSTPSIAQLKHTTLPGLITPTKVCGHFIYFKHAIAEIILQVFSTDGTPFYMISPTSTVKQVFGNPETSKLMHRFPVVPKQEIRYHNYTLDIYCA